MTTDVVERKRWCWSAKGMEAFCLFTVKMTVHMGKTEKVSELGQFGGGTYCTLKPLPKGVEDYFLTLIMTADILTERERR